MPRQAQLDHTSVCPREVMKGALIHNADTLIVVPSHASGDPKPSRDDIEMTPDMATAAVLGTAIHVQLRLAAIAMRAAEA
jgi:DNA repair protein RadC